MSGNEEELMAGKMEPQKSDVSFTECGDLLVIYWVSPTLLAEHKPSSLGDDASVHVYKHQTNSEGADRKCKC